MKFITFLTVAFLFNSGANAWVDPKTAQTLIKHYRLSGQAWGIEEKCDFLTQEEKESFYHKKENFGNYVKYVYSSYQREMISELHLATVTGHEAVSKFGCDRRNEEAVKESVNNVAEINEILNIKPGQQPVGMRGNYKAMQQLQEY